MRTALALIKQTYGQKGRIIISHVSKLLNLEVKENPDKGALRILFNKVKTYVRSLEVLGIDAEQYGILLVPIVLSKLTHALRKEWGKRKNYDNLVKLLDFLEEEIRSVEEARQVENAFAPEKEHRSPKKQTESSDERSSTYRQRDYRSNYSPNTATALHSSSQNMQKWCYYCQNKEHSTQTCTRLEKCSGAEVRNFLVLSDSATVA